MNADRARKASVVVLEMIRAIETMAQEICGGKALELKQPCKEGCGPCEWVLSPGVQYALKYSQGKEYQRYVAEGHVSEPPYVEEIES